MNFIAKFFHEFLNPHCEDCIQEDLNNPLVEELKLELANIRRERDRLLDYVLLKSEPQIEYNPSEDLEPIQPKTVPWKIRKHMLEAEDSKKAALIRKNKEEQADAIAELEKNLGVIRETTLDLENGNVQREPVKVNE